MNTSTVNSFIDPRELLAIKDLKLAAKTVVDGFWFGLQRGMVPGHGMEFNQFRSYNPGDDPRNLDWKLYARSDRFYIREAEADSRINVYFVLDASASMRHAEKQVIKLDYAKFLTAALGYLADQQGDAIGLSIVSNDAVVSIPLRHEKRQFYRFLHHLDETEAGGRWPLPDLLDTIFGGMRQRSMVIFASDLHEGRNEIRTMLEQLSAAGHEVIVLHLLARNELEFDYPGISVFEDLETGEIVHGAANKMRDNYLEQFRAWLATIRDSLYTHQIDYQQICIDQPLDQALRHYLIRRTNRSA